MSIDRSLKTSGKLAAKRSVLTRAERISKMIEEKKVTQQTAKALGIPKTLAPKS